MIWSAVRERLWRLKDAGKNDNRSWKREKWVMDRPSAVPPRRCFFVEPASVRESWVWRPSAAHGKQNNGDRND